MQSFHLDSSSPARLIGGEMLDWSDLTEEVDAALLRSLIEQLPRPGRALLIGPRAALLADGLNAGHVEVLVRGLPDARKVAVATAWKDDLTVWAGSLEQLEVDQPFDLVVLLDGPERVLSPDAPGLSHREVLQQVAEFVADDGLLVALVNNGMGSHELLRLPMEDRASLDLVDVSLREEVRPERTEQKQRHDGDDEDADEIPVRDRFVGANANENWWHGATGYDQRGPYVTELDDLWQGSALTRIASWAVFPSPDQPALLIDRDTLDDPEINQVGRAQAVRLQAELFSRKPSLTEPAEFIEGVFAAGLADSLASGWLFLARRGAASDDVNDADANLPDLLVSDLWSSEPWRATVGYHRDEDGWHRRNRGRQPEMAERKLRRDFTAFAAPATGGRSLETMLREAMSGGNLLPIRSLVRRYAQFLSGDAVPAEARLFADPANVIVTDAGLVLDDPSWSWSEEISREVAGVVGLRRFAIRALHAGINHPWRPDISPDEMAETMAVMAGLVCTPTLLNTAATLEAELNAILRGIPGDELPGLVAESIAMGASQFTATPGPKRGYRQAVERVSTMATALEVSQGQVDWMETALHMRERKLASAERMLLHTRTSASFKIGRFVTFPVRKLAELLRTGALRMVPPKLLERAERFARRVLK
ncbi:hypothetical protein [Enemella sp. A6]|uniref:hypothetical protein n=1 Tax=Enemella sp. A6 TaxID=3440152 RepID=UPI003EBAE2B3